MAVSYVISLARRTDRYAAFQKATVPAVLALGYPEPTLLEGVDGTALDINDDELRKRVNPWNFRYLREKTLRGVIGCCLSHLACYEALARGQSKYALIFEDDCVLVEPRSMPPGPTLPPLPAGVFGIIFLNRWDKVPPNTDAPLTYVPWVTGKTAESYIISREYAKILYEYNYNNIGAIDAHMGLCYKLHPEFPHYELSNGGIFCQRNRRDSDIQIVR